MNLNINLEHLIELNKDLGINIQSQLNRGLKIYPEAQDCVSVGTDFYKRESRLNPQALAAWELMVKAALADKIELFICSAFRDYQYQANLLRKKLAGGIDIDTIIKTLAPPGFSEHHTGCAIDIISSEIPVLDQSFENTQAFGWLQNYAQDFNFSMTYPRNNIYGMIYEPWHWCFRV